MKKIVIIIFLLIATSSISLAASKFDVSKSDLAASIEKFSRPDIGGDVAVRKVHYIENGNLNHLDGYMPVIAITEVKNKKNETYYLVGRYKMYGGKGDFGGRVWRMEVVLEYIFTERPTNSVAALLK